MKVYKNDKELGQAFQNSQLMKDCDVLYPTLQFCGGGSASFVQPEGNSVASSGITEEVHAAVQ